MTTQTSDEFEALRKRIAVPCWVEPGWQQIVVDAVKKIEWLLEQDPLVSVVWGEIKTWHGTLAMRFRIEDTGEGHVVSDLIADVVTAAKVRADHTCMVCGSAGARFFEDGEGLRVLCRKHEFVRDQHQLDEAQVRAILEQRYQVIEVMTLWKRKWRVVGFARDPKGVGLQRRMETMNWSEVAEAGVDYVDLVELDGVQLLRERDLARHRASAALVREAVDEEFERLELNFGIVEVGAGARLGEWIVSVTNGSQTHEEKWIEADDDDVPGEIAAETARVRIVRVFN